MTLNVAGTWHGTAQRESCEGFGDPRSCLRMAPPGTVAQIVLTLTQDGSAVQGSLDLRTVPSLGPPAYPAHYVGDLSGSVAPDGLLRLSGPTRWVPLPDTAVDRSEVRDWNTRVLDGVQTGTFSQAFPTPLYTPPFTGMVKWAAVSLRR